MMSFRDKEAGILRHLKLTLVASWLQSVASSSHYAILVLPKISSGTMTFQLLNGVAARLLRYGATWGACIGRSAPRLSVRGR